MAAPSPASRLALGEFDLIARHFKRPASATRAGGKAVLGVGDDCALFAPAPGRLIATSTDTLVEGRHFFADVAPDALGHKALAVNLSDLAACGAEPRVFLLALALPEAHDAWLAGFARGMFALADAQGIELIGGDTTRSPLLTLTISVMGEVPAGGALLRSGAQAGDDLWVSGELGGARWALEVMRGQWPAPAHFAPLRARLERPEPRVALGLALRGIATSAIDLSDGLLGDLAHVLAASQVGARVEEALLPAPAGLRDLPGDAALRCLLAGGDDYELLFTAPHAAAAAVQAAAHKAQTPVTRIGGIQAGSGCTVVDARGAAMNPAAYRSFDHFGPPAEHTP